MNANDETWRNNTAGLMCAYDMCLIADRIELIQIVCDNVSALQSLHGCEKKIER